MELRKLHHAVVLARLLNFTKAGEALNLTQSALSRSIQALEAECQLRLFDRNRNMVALTPVGREFIRHAEVLLRNEAELQDMVAHAAKGDSGTIALGMAPLAARTLLTPLMVEMIARPGFHASIAIGSPRRLLSMLADEAIEICVCTGQVMPAHAPLSSVLLARFAIALVVRVDHPLTKRGSVDPQSLDQFPILRTRPDLDDDAPSAFDWMPRKRPAVAVEDYDVLMRIAANSDAVWVTSPVSAREGIMNGTLTHLPISWLPKPTEFDMTAYYPKRRTLSPLAETILERLGSLSREVTFFSTPAKNNRGSVTPAAAAP